MPLRLLAFLLLAAGVLHAAEIKGKVTNAVGGEALGRVQVVVLETRASTTTSSEGEFSLPNLASGKYTLRLNAVSYRLLTIPFTLAEGEVKEFSVTMAPDNFHRTDKVEVHGDVFQGADSPATNQMNITSYEIRESSTVFADDPFRAVQALPGVSAEGNNEFFAEFSVMGAPFSSVSIYVDDVLVPSPFHEIGSFAEGASLSVLTSEVVEEMKLMPAAYPEKYGDAAGAALDVRTRDGSRASPLFRLTTGIVTSEFLAEGGLGKAPKGSWLLSARRSYINYLIHNRAQDSAEVGFYDGDAKLNYDLTPRQNLSFYAVGGHTNMQDDTVTDANSYASGHSDFLLARAGWRWSINPHLLLDARGAYIREPDELRNESNLILNTSDYREWVGGGGITWNWAHDSVLEAGWSVRRIRDNLSSGFYDQTTGGSQSSQYGGSAIRNSGYVQQASSLWKGRVHVLGGVRWDSLQQLDLHPFSPQISVALRATASTEFQFGAGRYQQFPPVMEWSNSCYSPTGMPEKSNQYTAGVEQRLNESTRLRVQVFDRQNSLYLGGIPGQTQQFVQTPCGHAVEPLPNSTFQRSYSRGAQLILQRRSANRLSGWVGYTFTSARERDFQVNAPGSIVVGCASICASAPTLDDQRHSFNLFGTYRFRPSINLSGKFLYGSGFPVSIGLFQQVGTAYVASGVGTIRLPYARLDFRADKDWAFRRWKLTLYGEVLNVTNHYNSRFVFASGIDPNTLQSQVQTLQGLPITPTVGLVFQF